jgi:transcriptional regulator with XRE-family HTH domain
MMDMKQLVGRNFARLRRERNLTQEQVAAFSGISQQYISGIESGRRNPTLTTLQALAKALGVSHVDLVMPDDQI